MNKIEQMIADLCPEGVEWLELGSVVDYEQPTPYLVKSTEYHDSFPIPVLTAGQTFILGYTNESNGVYPASAESPVIIFDDFTTASKWVDFNFKAKSSAMKMLTSRNNEKLNLRFLWHYLPSIEIDSSQHTRYWISKFSLKLIPIPPIQIQNEIVNILDQFVQLGEDLEQERIQRIKQFVHYREYLCQQDVRRNQNFPMRPLGEVATLIRGRRFVKDDILESGAPAIHYGELYTKFRTTASQSFSFLDPVLADKLRKVKKGDVVLVAAGETIEDIGKSVAWLGEEDVVIHDACIGVSSKILNPTFMAFYFDSFAFRSQLREHITSSKISAISPDRLAKVLVPTPELEIQNEIVNNLLKFESLINDQEFGIPAEIETRRKQYEYYREKLLTFKELKSA